jgi:hypothetical protein
MKIDDDRLVVHPPCTLTNLDPVLLRPKRGLWVEGEE